MMKILIALVVVGIGTLIGGLLSARRISGRENDDRQQLEYIWSLQEKKNKKE